MRHAPVVHEEARDHAGELQCAACFEQVRRVEKVIYAGVQGDETVG